MKREDYILVIDDERDICEQICAILEDNFFSTSFAYNSEDAFKKIIKIKPNLVILDIWLNNSKLDGFTLLKKIKNFDSKIPVIMISGHGNIEKAINWIKNGAFDFIEKPFDIDLLIYKVKKAQENQQLKNKIEKLIDNNLDFKFVANSKSTKQLKETIDKIAKTESSILLNGPAGSGKELLAKFIHKKSNRVNNSFRVVNCANLNPENFEQKLFGVEKNNGEFITGLLEDSDGGTILFDQIEDMPISTQGKIIGFLEEQKFTRFGGIKSLKTNVRIISSTKTDLENNIKLNLFREDLFFKLNVIPINVPSLHERKDDIEDLVNIFIDDYSKQNNFKKKFFSSECIEFFKSLKLTGNARQLRNLIQWVLTLLAESKNTKIEINHIPNEIKSQFNKNLDHALLSELPMKDARENFEKNYIEQFLYKYDFNINKVSNIIGMERTALYRKIKNLNINLSKK